MKLNNRRKLPARPKSKKGPTCEGCGRIFTIVTVLAVLLWVLFSRSDSLSSGEVQRDLKLLKEGEINLLRKVHLLPSNASGGGFGWNESISDAISEKFHSLQLGLGLGDDASSGGADHADAAADEGEGGSAGLAAGAGIGSGAGTSGSLKGPNKHWKPYNGSFYIHWKNTGKSALEKDINKEGLQRVYLDHTRFGSESAGEASRGPECPDFEYAYGAFANIGACWQAPLEDPDLVPTLPPRNCPNLTRSCIHNTDFQPHERWASQVLVLHNVYVNVAGQIFNDTHFFDHNSCASEHPFLHPASATKVTSYRELVSLVDWFAWDAKTSLLTLLPLMVSLEQVLPMMRGVPLAFGLRAGHQKNQLQKMKSIGLQDLLGLDLETMNPQILDDGELFFAEKLIVPLHQRCGKPSRALWQHLRSKHLLPVDGLPMYNPDYTPRARDTDTPQPPLVDTDDWVVLLGLRRVKKPLIATLKLEKVLKTLFPPERVLVYHEGSMGMARRKELLNRAKVLIAVHDDILSDMVFMPPGGTVFEIRPRAVPEPIYHHLAEICGHSYYLMLAEGKRGGPLRMKRPSVVYSLVSEIAATVLKSMQSLSAADDGGDVATA